MINKANDKVTNNRHEVAKIQTYNGYVRDGGSEKARERFRRPAYSVPGKKEKKDE